MGEVQNTLRNLEEKVHNLEEKVDQIHRNSEEKFNKIIDLLEATPAQQPIQSKKILGIESWKVY